MIHDHHRPVTPTEADELPEAIGRAVLGNSRHGDAESLAGYILLKIRVETYEARWRGESGVE